MSKSIINPSIVKCLGLTPEGYWKDMRNIDKRLFHNFSKQEFIVTFIPGIPLNINRNKKYHI